MTDERRGRPAAPIPPQYTRGWCSICHDLSVRGDTGACDRCGAGLADGFDFVEAADEVLLEQGVRPRTRHGRPVRVGAGQEQMYF